MKYKIWVSWLKDLWKDIEVLLNIFDIEKFERLAFHNPTQPTDSVSYQTSRNILFQMWLVFVNFFNFLHISRKQYCFEIDLKSESFLKLDQSCIRAKASNQRLISWIRYFYDWNMTCENCLYHLNQTLIKIRTIMTLIIATKIIKTLRKQTNREKTRKTEFGNKTRKSYFWNKTRIENPIPQNPTQRRR